jgi:pyruvate dehydrogenase E2 component (dihydrolipoamide acetyltransferase)
MSTEFKLPELGENIDSADIVKVTVSEGDVVEVDQVVMEIETDKATVEVPSDVGGTVKKVHVKDGDTAKVGQVILTLEENGTQEKDQKPETGEKKEEKPKEEKKQEPKPETLKPQKRKSTGKEIVEFKLPELGENIESADVTKVLVKAGDKVEADQSVLEIETDKATVEVPTEVGGTVKEVKIKDGDTAKVGQVVFLIETSESVEEEDEPAENKEEVKPEKPKEEPAESVKETGEVSTTGRRKLNMPEKIAPAAPSVRRFAREIGIDIHNVPGSGPGGRISVDDVKAYSKEKNESISSGGFAGIAGETLPDFSKWGGINREKMSNVRKKTAEHLSYAWATVPHVTQFEKADITALEKLRKEYSKKAEEAGGKLTVTAILLKIIASALKVYPQFNSSIDMKNQEIIYKKYFNIGVAVDTEKGLLVPVIKDVDKKNIIELSVELAEISKKARDKKLSLEEMQGGNFSISNLGGIGGTYFSPIVNTPEVAILGVSRGSYEQVYFDGKFEPRLMLPLSLSYDHRIIDGADGIRFLRWVAQALENPFILSLEG